MNELQDEEDEADLDLEGEDFVEGESLDSLVLEEQVESVVLDEEALAAIEAAQGFITTYNDELVAEADMGGDELSSADAVAAKAAGALDSILSSGAVDAALAIAGSDIAEAEGVEDAQGPRGFRKYDEDEQTGLSEEQRDQIAGYKLTKTELANLVPEVRLSGEQALRLDDVIRVHAATLSGLGHNQCGLVHQPEGGEHPPARVQAELHLDGRGVDCYPAGGGIA